MKDPQHQLRETAKGLLADGRVDVLIGYQHGTLPGRARPCFVRKPEDAEKLVWDATCSNNLSVYLPAQFRKPDHPGKEPPPQPRVGVVVKGCDALSVALLVKEHQVPRENVVIIGMPCQGITEAGSKEIMPSCVECRTPVAEGIDIAIEGESRPAAQTPFADIEEFENRPIDERWEYFKSEMSKCVRCFACRQACPNCYCPECFAEQTTPKWISVGNELSDTMLFHLGRMFHQVGRCVGCDACVRACPMGVDLRTFTHKLARDAKQLYDYEISASPEDAPLFTKFEADDSDSFITDPDKAPE